MIYSFELFEAKRKTKQLGMMIVFFIILVGGWFYPLLGYFIPLCMLLGIGTGFLKGRKWCDWVCPRGSFYDTLGKRICPQKQIPRVLKTTVLRAVVILVLMSVMAVNLIMRWPNPESIGKFFVIMLTATTILGVILAAIFHQRSWCMICPIGSIIKWTSARATPLKIDSGACVECKLCAKNCPVQIKPYQFKQEGFGVVRDADCLKCNLCIAVCPKKALSRA